MNFQDYIAAVATENSSPKFEWAEWNFRSYFLTGMEKDFISEISDGAALSLCLGSASWIINRFRKLNSDEMPLMVVDAGWAFFLNSDAVTYYEPTDEDWFGPIRGPLSATSIIIMDALFARDADPEIRSRVAWFQTLARHVLGADVEKYEQWLEWAYCSLQSHHPRAEMKKKGIFDYSIGFAPAVGPSSFVPDSGYVPANARQEIYDMLMAGDRSNPLINYAALRP